MAPPIQLLLPRKVNLTGKPRDDPQWLVGARYEVSQTVQLYTRPDTRSETCGRLFAGDPILVLALKATAPSEGNGEGALLVYVANTKRRAWTHGWGKIEGQGLRSSVLRRRRLKGSWEVGGRYRVLGSLALKQAVELESQHLCEIQSDEEVLVVELGLVIRGGEPRLRAHVRADSGALGWLTLELPGGKPLLDPVNLYSAAAKRGMFPRCLWPQECRRSSGHRISVTGVVEGSEEAWEAGGKYRTLGTTAVCQAKEHGSTVLGTLKAGALVVVQQVSRADELHSGLPRDALCLHVVAEDADGKPWLQGWISSKHGSGKALLDTRDHLELEKLMGYSNMHLSRPSPEELEEEVLDAAHAGWGGAAGRPVTGEASVHEFSVQLCRSQDSSLGIHVDHADGKTLLIEELTAGGLFEQWNTEVPDRQVCVGDRIICVNTSYGNSLALVQELSQQQTLDITLQREVYGAPPMSPPKQPRPVQGNGDLERDPLQRDARLDSTDHQSKGGPGAVSPSSTASSSTSSKLRRGAHPDDLVGSPVPTACRGGDIGRRSPGVAELHPGLVEADWKTVGDGLNDEDDEAVCPGCRHHAYLDSLGGIFGCGGNTRPPEAIAMARPGPYAAGLGEPAPEPRPMSSQLRAPCRSAA